MKTKFDLEDRATVVLNGVTGTVTGLAVYRDYPPQAQVYHLDGNGNAVYNWYLEVDLEPAN